MVNKNECEVVDGYIVLYSQSGDELRVAQGCDIEAYLKKGFTCGKPPSITSDVGEIPIKTGRKRHEGD